MDQEVQIAPVRHHPRNGIHVTIHGHKDGKIRSDEWGSILNIAPSGFVHCKGAERRQVENVQVIALGDVKTFDEGGTEGARILRAVRVVFEFVSSHKIWIEEDMDVVRLESPCSRLACAIRFVFHSLRVCIRQGEDDEKKEDSSLNRRARHLGKLGQPPRMYSTQQKNFLSTQGVVTTRVINLLVWRVLRTRAKTRRLVTNEL